MISQNKKPEVRPADPNFSSGPCTKRPGWNYNNLCTALLGRSHRSDIGKEKLKEVIEYSKKVLEIPKGFVVGIVPASGTGAMEMAMWSFLGARAIDVLVWESFGLRWASDIKQQLKLRKVRKIEAEYGKLPDLSNVDFNSDVVFTWNGTASGVRVPNGDWIEANRKGLTIVDATSAVFAMDLPWEKIDVATWSWQKALGGEAAHGMIALGPRAIDRLESYVPVWPIPRVFCLTRDGKLNKSIFEGETINTPSMLAVEDALDGLKWAMQIGGLSSLIARTNRNAEAVSRWVSSAPWIGYLCADSDSRSTTSVTLNIVDQKYFNLGEIAQRMVVRSLLELLSTENAGFDFGSHAHAPPGLRIWCGSTIEQRNLEAFFPWLDWGFFEVMKLYQ